MKKKVLLLGDDFRLPSGIGTISKEIILNTVDRFDWVQIGGALQHPDLGKLLDMSQEIQRATGVSDASVKVIPVNGYGDRNILFQVLEHEKPDVILHFTDPRYWTWMYDLEHEIKTLYKVPITYYAIWDDLPYPMWNAPYYASSDLIMGISKQSHNIHNQVLNQNGIPTIDLDEKTRVTPASWNTVYTKFIPHGLDENVYKPLNLSNPKFAEMYASIKTNRNLDFIFFWNNRNIRRKLPADVILSFARFLKLIPEEQRSRVALMMHTEPVDANGTDLRAVHKTIAPDANVIFSTSKIPSEELNMLYNISDVVINIASNEGWGLSSTEALLSGTPIINSVTGGLQDQMRFEDNDGNWITFNKDVPSNHTGIYQAHGEWAKPVFPSNRSLQGSPTTPYIFDDRVESEDVAQAMLYWYNMDEVERKEKGEKGRTFAIENGLTSKQMATSIADCIEFMLLPNTKEPRPRYHLRKSTSYKYSETGII